MPKLTREQAQKWTKDLPQGWKFDAQHYVFWGEKEIFTDSAENEKGVFYRLTLEYRDETEDAGYFRKKTGRQIPTVSISRYTPTGCGEMYSVVHVLTESAAEPESKKKYNVLVNLAATIDTADYFKRAAEKDTGKAYNDFSDFSGVIEDVTENAAEDSTEAAQEATEETQAEEVTEDSAENENATEAQENADNVPPYMSADAITAAFIADGWTLSEPFRDATAEEIENAGYYVKSAAENGEKFYIMSNGNMYDQRGKIVYFNIPAQIQSEDAPTVEESAETVTEDAQTVTESAPDESKEESAPDMFATLAAAYFSGKTVKSKPRTIEPKKEEVKEDEPPKVEEVTPPPVPGWHENDNESWKFSEDERKALSAGSMVFRKERYNNGAWFTVPYAERVKMVYCVHSSEERDSINPGKDASFCGFMIDENIYSEDIRRIDAKLCEDIERYLQEHIKSETDAAHVAANIESEYDRRRLEEMKAYDYYSEAKRLFFDRKRPELTLYTVNNPRETHGYEAIINYLLEPEKTIEIEALRYMCDYPEKIYAAWIRFNRLSASFEKIDSDKENDEHKLMRIANAINEQKTVRLLLTNNATVKVEADAVKRIPYNGYISSYYVSASDRELLPKDGRHAKDICPADIVEISHGGRVLYSA